MRPDLKKNYSSREVASLTGLSARQLQWWDARKLLKPSIAPHRTEAGGFTERRYSPIDLFELAVLADLRRSGLSVSRLRLLLETLRRRFGVRLFDASAVGGVLRRQICARTDGGSSSICFARPVSPCSSDVKALKELKLPALKNRPEEGAPQQWRSQLGGLPIGNTFSRSSAGRAIAWTPRARRRAAPRQLLRQSRLSRMPIAAHDGGDETRVNLLPSYERRSRPSPWHRWLVR
jgi:DNA-binding transcriptional MerR regulator